MMKQAIEVVLVEDPGWQKLRPLTWLRPAAELVVGAHTMRERWCSEVGGEVRILCRPEAARLGPGRIDRLPEQSMRRLWIRDRFLPDRPLMREMVEAEAGTAWTNEGRVIAVRTDSVPVAEATDDRELLWSKLSDRLPTRSVEQIGRLDELSDLIAESAARIESDLTRQLPPDPSADRLGDGVAYEPGRIAVGEGCRIDHGAVLDARDGPIVLGAGTQVSPHTWIRGPFGCRENCLLLGGRIGGGTFLGPRCRVHGEVEASTFHGYCNKAHDGFVGHSYLGEWVNLGAGTTTSDLKNNYGSVRLEAYSRSIDTGRRKIGSFLGDHVKSRIGALLNSGTVVGVGSNLIGEVSLFPKWVPDFLWGVGRQADEYALDRCLQTAEIVLSRRGVSLTTEVRDALRKVFEETASLRKTFMCD